jgi:hypothetical protein
LCDAYLSPNSPDPIHAAETLSKLHYRIDPNDRDRFMKTADKLPPGGMPCARWLFAISGNDGDLHALADLLDAKDPMVRSQAAYALRHLRDRLPQSIIAQIAGVASKELDGAGRAYLLSAAYITAREPQQVTQFRDLLIPFTQSGTKDQKYETASALAIRGEKHDLPLMTKLLDDPEPDVRVAAANAVLRISCR